MISYSSLFRALTWSAALVRSETQNFSIKGVDEDKINTVEKYQSWHLMH